MKITIEQAKLLFNLVQQESTSFVKKYKHDIFTDQEKYNTQWNEYKTLMNKLLTIMLQKGETVIVNEIKCPYCNTVSEDCDFPDLFYSDINNTEGLNEQYKLLQELQSKGYNLVSCGDCGKVFIIKEDEE